MHVMYSAPDVDEVSRCVGVPLSFDVELHLIP